MNEGDERMVEESDKKNMLTVIEQYQLKVPEADIKTMPEGLRKEVRNFVTTYVGQYRTELGVVRTLKLAEFKEKNSSRLNKRISLAPDILKILTRFEKAEHEFRKAYQDVASEKRLDLSTTMWEFKKNEDEPNKKITAKVGKSHITTEIAKKFDDRYGDGFRKFHDLLGQFEAKIEEAVIFGTITDCYTLIKNYAKFDPYLKKIAALKIR